MRTWKLMSPHIKMMNQLRWRVANFMEEQSELDFEYVLNQGPLPIQ